MEELMSLYLNYMNIIREYILYHSENTHFKRVYYFLIDYEYKKVINCFDTETSCNEYLKLIENSECFNNDFLKTFEPDIASSMETSHNIQFDKLRIMEQRFLYETGFDNQKLHINDIKNTYRFIFMSYTLYGLKYKQGKLWFTDQDWITYRLGNKITSKTEYDANRYIYPSQTGSFCRKFWYNSDTTLMQILKKLSFNFDLLW